MGGKSDDINGVCASATFNMKKRNNSADTTYLFRNGQPTPLYYELFGPPPSTVTERLRKMANLKSPDWYFNRSITWILQALHYKCWSPYWDKKPVRDDKYWFKAAFNKMEEFRAIAGSFLSIEERCLIGSPTNEQAILLSLRDSYSLESFTKQALELFPAFQTNSKVWDEYFHPEEYAESDDQYDNLREAAYKKAVNSRVSLTQETFHCIESDYKIRYIPFSPSR